MWKLERDCTEDVEIILAKERAPAAVELTLGSKQDPDFRAIIILSSPGGSGIALSPLNQVRTQRLIEEAGISGDFQDAMDMQKPARQGEKASFVSATSSSIFRAGTQLFIITLRTVNLALRYYTSGWWYNTGIRTVFLVFFERR